MITSVLPPAEVAAYATMSLQRESAVMFPLAVVMYIGTAPATALLLKNPAIASSVLLSHRNVMAGSSSDTGFFRKTRASWAAIRKKCQGTAVIHD